MAQGTCTEAIGFVKHGVTGVHQRRSIAEGAEEEKQDESLVKNASVEMSMRFDRAPADAEAR